MYLNAIRLLNPYKLDAYTKVDNLVPLLSLGFNSRTKPTADFFVYLFQYVNERVLLLMLYLVRLVRLK